MAAEPPAPFAVSAAAARQHDHAVAAEPPADTFSLTRRQNPGSSITLQRRQNGRSIGRGITTALARPHHPTIATALSMASA